MKSKRLKYFILTVIVMVLGLLSRKMSPCTIDFVKIYLGDVLWAMMVYFGCRFLFAGTRKRMAFGCALLFSYGIEISQLYHTPWIDAIRSTMLGGLMLGYGFLWGDVVCYTVGVTLGIVIDWLLGEGNERKHFNAFSR